MPNQKEGSGTAELEEDTEETELEESFHARTSGFILRMLLGPINVRAARKDSRFKVKEEYNTYRDRTAVMFPAYPVLLLGLNYQIWNGCFPAVLVQVYQARLLFFYTSLALRENILRVNGSDIRPWWVYHHYCAMVMALISLTWGFQGHPLCVREQEFGRYYPTQDNSGHYCCSGSGCCCPRAAFCGTVHQLEPRDRICPPCLKT